MFSWLYLKLKKDLDVSRDEAYAVYQLALLTRCMPGGVAQVGDSSPAMARLLSEAVGDGREILICSDGAEDAPAPLANAVRMSTLPGLDTPAVPVAGRQFYAGGIGEARKIIRDNLRFCFVHCLRQDPDRLREALAFFLDRLSLSGMLLIEIPAGAAGQESRAVIQELLADRNERLVNLQTPHCLVLRLPEIKPAPSRPSVRVRSRGALESAA